jgi:hypothetical protein
MALLQGQERFFDNVKLRPDLKVTQIFNEKPKKGEKATDESAEPIEVDTRTGYYPDDIANTFGVPMEQYKKETAISDMDGFVTMRS